jgi:hypothetical protein
VATTKTKTAASAGLVAPAADAVVISPPSIGTVDFLIRGTAPLVIERFAKKAELMLKMQEGTTARNRKERTARDYEVEAEAARYRSEDGNWEGINAAAFRAGMISACRLVAFKMTLAKLSVFIVADGHDTFDGLPLVRIFGESRVFTAHTRNATGVADVRSRPQYRDWACVLRVRFDQDQFKLPDILNLLARVGGQVGIGAGRPDSKSSAGCGWGTFALVPASEEAAVRKHFNIT